MFSSCRVHQQNEKECRHDMTEDLGVSDKVRDKNSGLH